MCIYNCNTICIYLIWFSLNYRIDILFLCVSSRSSTRATNPIKQLVVLMATFYIEDRRSRAVHRFRIISRTICHFWLILLPHAFLFGVAPHASRRLLSRTGIVCIPHIEINSPPPPIRCLYCCGGATERNQFDWFYCVILIVIWTEERRRHLVGGIGERMRFAASQVRRYCKVVGCCRTQYIIINQVLVSGLENHYYLLFGMSVPGLYWNTAVF